MGISIHPFQNGTEDKPAGKSALTNRGVESGYQSGKWVSKLNRPSFKAGFKECTSNLLSPHSLLRQKTGPIGKLIVQSLDFHSQARVHGVLQKQPEEHLSLVFQFLMILERIFLIFLHASYPLKPKHNVLQVPESANCLIGASFWNPEPQHGGCKRGTQFIIRQF
ncbi:MAG TPA: hypothetical protein VNU20_08975 [Candidatus Sulfotelmatobacter sp.]|nr:hypothetical protein [Candidatus Sulfotelmatobacter sp.]